VINVIIKEIIIFFFAKNNWNVLKIFKSVFESIHSIKFVIKDSSNYTFDKVRY